MTLLTLLTMVVVFIVVSTVVSSLSGVSRMWIMMVTKGSDVAEGESSASMMGCRLLVIRTSALVALALGVPMAALGMSLLVMTGAAGLLELGFQFISHSLFLCLLFSER